MSGKVELMARLPTGGGCGTRWTGPRFGAVVLTTLLLSLSALNSPALIDFFSPLEIALAWLEHLTELAVIALALTVAYTLMDAALPPRAPGRLLLICATLFALAGLL